jgi:hypothetical protein
MHHDGYVGIVVDGCDESGVGLHLSSISGAGAVGHITDDGDRGFRQVSAAAAGCEGGGQRQA